MATKDGKKTGGRQKGTPNKKTQDVMEVCERLGLNPIEVLARFALGDWNGLGYESAQIEVNHTEYGSVLKYTIDPGVRSKCAAELASYIFPKRKAIEHSGPDGDPLQTLVVEVVHAKKD
jgi:hypothetical protein